MIKVPEKSVVKNTDTDIHAYTHSLAPRMADRAPVPTIAIVFGARRGSAFFWFFNRTADADPMVRVRL